jgi:hypothetical protein
MLTERLAVLHLARDNLCGTDLDFICSAAWRVMEVRPDLTDAVHSLIQHISAELLADGHDNILGWTSAQLAAYGMRTSPSRLWEITHAVSVSWIDRMIDNLSKELQHDQ